MGQMHLFSGTYEKWLYLSGTNTLPVRPSVLLYLITEYVSYWNSKRVARMCRVSKVLGSIPVEHEVARLGLIASKFQTTKERGGKEFRKYITRTIKDRTILYRCMYYSGVRCGTVGWGTGKSRVWFPVGLRQLFIPAAVWLWGRLSV